MIYWPAICKSQFSNFLSHNNQNHNPKMWNWQNRHKQQGRVTFLVWPEKRILKNLRMWMK